MDVELSNSKAKNATPNSDYLWQVVEIVNGGVPTIHEVRFMCLLMRLGRILLQGSISTNLLDPVRYQVDPWKVEVSI